MKTLSLLILLSGSLFLAAVEVAAARPSLLTVITSGASVEQATANARTLLRIECNFLSGHLIGTLEVIESVGFSIKAQQVCDVATRPAVEALITDAAH